MLNISKYIEANKEKLLYNPHYQREILTTYDIATPNEIDLVCSIDGYNKETMCNILYVRTGFRDFEQFMECEG